MTETIALMDLSLTELAEDDEAQFLVSRLVRDEDDENNTPLKVAAFQSYIDPD